MTMSTVHRLMVNNDNNMPFRNFTDNEKKDYVPKNA